MRLFRKIKAALTVMVNKDVIVIAFKSNMLDIDVMMPDKKAVLCAKALAVSMDIFKDQQSALNEVNEIINS